MDNNATSQTTSGWKVNDDWKQTKSFPKWKTFSDQISYRPYTIKDMQSTVDDAEPENMYNNASGCGTPPLLAWGVQGKKKLEAYRACTARASSSTQNLDNAIAESLRARANQPQGGISTGTVVMLVGLVAVVGVGIFFLVKK